MLINRYKTRTAPAPQRCTQARKAFRYLRSAQAKHRTTSALPHPDMALLSVHGNKPDHRSPRMARRLTATGQSVALPAERSPPATRIIDIQPITNTGARLRRLMGSAWAEGMMLGISSSITEFTKCGGHAITLGIWVLYVNKLICIGFLFNSRRQEARSCGSR